MESLLDATSCDNIDHKIIVLLKVMSMLQELEDQLENLARTGKSLSGKLLKELSMIVKHPKFVNLFANRKNFQFRFDFLENLVSADDDDPNNMYITIFEILAFLSKNDETSQRFHGCMLDNVEYFSLKLDVNDPDHKWALDTGCEFRIKLAYLYIPRPQHDSQQVLIEIDRKKLVQDSISKVIAVGADDLVKGISIRFMNEEGIGDGVRRDWIISLVGRMVESQNAFETSGDDLAWDYTRIYPKGSLEDAAFYRCFGRLISLALMHKIPVGFTLDNVLFLRLAEKEITLEDIRITAPYKYNSYNNILESSPDSFARRYCYYSDYDDGGDELIHPTREEVGRVALENREKFVAEKIHKEFVRSTKAQTDDLLEGLDDLLSVYRPLIFQTIRLEDLDCMIRGIQELKIEDWIKFTTYEGFRDTDPQITWFWQCVKDLSEKRKRKLLYIWGSIKYLPRGGFEALRPPLSISNWQQSGVSLEHLPKAQTCFCTLMFPPYESYEIMHKKLLFSIDNCDCTFQLE